MSPRAACRLEQLGFSDVYDYVGGKTDWLAYDLPYVGENLLVSSVLRRNVPTAERYERLAAVGERFDKAPAGMLVVVADGIVNGIVKRKQAEGADPDLTLEHVMNVGAATVRPAEDVDQLLHRMEHAGVSAITVTRPDGVLVGIFDAENY